METAWELFNWQPWTMFLRWPSLHDQGSNNVLLHLKLITSFGVSKEHICIFSLKMIQIPEQICIGSLLPVLATD